MIQFRPPHFRVLVTTAMSERATPAWMATRDLSGEAGQPWIQKPSEVSFCLRLEGLTDAEAHEDGITNLLRQARVLIDGGEEPKADCPQEPACQNAFLEPESVFRHTRRAAAGDYSRGVGAHSIPTPPRHDQA